MGSTKTLANRSTTATTRSQAHSAARQTHTKDSISNIWKWNQNIYLLTPKKPQTTEHEKRPTKSRQLEFWEMFQEIKKKHTLWKKPYKLSVPLKRDKVIIKKKQNYKRTTIPINFRFKLSWKSLESSKI
jgi:hypothetical protein